MFIWTVLCKKSGDYWVRLVRSTVNFILYCQRGSEFPFILAWHWLLRCLASHQKLVRSCVIVPSRKPLIQDKVVEEIIWKTLISLRFVDGSYDFVTKPKFNFLMRNRAHDLRSNSRMVYHLSHTITLLPHLFALLQHSVASNLQASAFDETTSKLESRFLKARLAAICDDKRRSVVECYRLNKSSSLLCSQQVRDFAACVGSARVVSCLSFLFNQCRPLIDVCISRPKVQFVDWPSQGVIVVD